jgi:hypothetical protein
VEANNICIEQVQKNEDENVQKEFDSKLEYMQYEQVKLNEETGVVESGGEVPADLDAEHIKEAN